jgi:heterodisulfide reductase subunit A-like polyferredoxin
MPDEAQEFVFFSPVLAEGMLETCGPCNACRHACPANAISVDTAGAVVDRQACALHVRASGGKCFDCLLACKHVVLSLRRFKRRADGSVQPL